MILQEGIEMFHHEQAISYFFKWWNIITAIMLTLFVLAALSWIVGFAVTGGWSVVDYSPVQFDKNKDGYQLLLLGNSFFSLAIVASIFYLFDLCQVKSQQYFPVCSILQNTVCWFAHLQETWLGNNLSLFVHLRETWLGNNLSLFVHLRETWLGNNVFLFVHLQETWLGNDVS
jgi:hypothetical protein